MLLDKCKSVCSTAHPHNRLHNSVKNIKLVNWVVVLQEIISVNDGDDDDDDDNDDISAWPDRFTL